MSTKKSFTTFGSNLRKLHGLRALEHDLAAPEKIVARAKVLYPDKDPQEILDAMRRQYDALDKELELEQHAAPIRKMGVFRKTGPRPFQVQMENGQVSIDQGGIQRYLGALTEECPALTIGQPKASGFKEYYWCKKDQASSTEVMIFWPFGQYPAQLPNGTFPGDWTGETGAWFVGWLKVKPRRLWYDPYDMVAHAAVFQFKIPAPKCDSVVYWGTKGRVAAANWIVTADPGWADTDWVLFESPEGADFPSTVEVFEFFPDGAFKNDRGDSVTYDGEVWDRSFHVSAGVESRIYLGLSVMLWGRNGKIELPGLQSYFNFDYGITYFMVPEA